MGAISDWTRIFESVNCENFECVILFSAPREDVAEEKTEIRKRVEESFWGKKALYSKGEAVFDDVIKGSFLPEETKLYGTINNVEKTFINAEEAIQKTARLREKSIKIPEESEKLNKIVPFEELFVGKEILTDDSNKNEDYKVKREKRQEIIKSIVKENISSGREDVRIEMQSVQKEEAEADIERITDALTLRLCDMMQKSAEGFYM